MSPVSLKDLTWDEVLARDDLVGGDFETQYGNNTFRGPIEKIERRGDHVWIITKWTAFRKGENSPWRFYRVQQMENEFMMPPSDSLPQVTQARVVTYSVQNFGTVTLTPAGQNNLDLRQVLGLSDSTQNRP